MKILVAGDWHSDLHEEAADQALRAIGHQTVQFKWFHYFRAKSFFSRVQDRYLFGPALERLNRDLVDAVRSSAPDAVLVYRGSHVFPRTLREIRRLCPAAVLVGYNNDDPFSPTAPRWMWRHFVRGLPHYDLALAYRHRNLREFSAAGARRVELLRSWFIPERHRPVELSALERERFGADVVFVGHYEPDGRLQCLEEVVRHGWKLRLFGHDYGWHPVLRTSPTLRGFMPVENAWGADYNKALCGAKVALCFLSKLNRDTYTRRCFEIPASGTLMLAEYTDDLAQLFKPGEEADFFRAPAELVEKLRYYLENDEARKRVARAGRQRVIADGHDVVSRMRQLTSWIADIARERHAAAA